MLRITNAACVQSGQQQQRQQRDAAGLQPIEEGEEGRGRGRRRRRRADGDVEMRDAEEDVSRLRCQLSLLPRFAALSLLALVVHLGCCLLPHA